MIGFFHHALDWALPSHCLLCHSSASSPGLKGLCHGCQSDLPWHHGNQCAICALPLAINTLDETLDHHNSLCGQCLKRPPAFDRCIAAFEYSTPIDSLISQFKHQRNLLAGKLLATLLRQRLEHQRQSNQSPYKEAPDLIVPVPLHWRRQIGRGFNQSAYLAEQLTHSSGSQLASIARRIRPTPRQQNLDRKQRLRNLKAAFVIDSDKVKGKSVALIDDVMTTGATAEALGSALKKAGATRVELWCVARTPKPGHH